MVFIEVDLGKVHCVKDICPLLGRLGIVAAHIGRLDPFLLPARPLFLSGIHAKIQDRDACFMRIVGNS